MSNSIRRAFALVAALLVGAGTTPWITAAAQTNQTDANQTTLRLVSQTLTVAPGGTATFLFALNGSLPDDAELVVDVHRHMAAPRAGVQEAVAGDIRPGTVGIYPVRVEDVPRDSAGRLTVTVPTVVRGCKSGVSFCLAAAGVYPVLIELRPGDGTEPLARLATFLVRLDEGASGAPLRVAVVLPLDGGPTLGADGTTVVDAADRDRLKVVTDAATATNAPVTLAPRPELLDGLGRGLPADLQLRDAFVGATTNTGPARQVLAQTYVRVDAATATDAGITDELARQLTDGEDTVAALLGPARTDRSTWLAEPDLDDAALAVLRNLGVRQLVVDSGAVTRPDPAPTTTLTEVVAVAPTADAVPVRAAVADQRLSEAVATAATQDDPVLAAYQWLAELAAIHFEAPAEARAGRGIVVAPPRKWRANPEFLVTMLAGLAAGPLTQPVTLDEWFRTVRPADGTARYSLTPSEAPDLRDYARNLARTRTNLTNLGSVLLEDNPLPVELEQQLRASVSADLDGDERQRYLDVVNGRLNRLRNAVEPLPRRTITLAGRTSELPVTLRRTVDFPVQVKVRLVSTKLTFPENDIVVVLDGDTVQRRFQVSARANGTFPLSVEILSPTGDTLVAPSTQLTVQATALSGLGIVLTFGAGLVLATWWVRHVRRARRRRRSADSLARHPSVVPDRPTND